jgi:hypothetical protein
MEQISHQTLKSGFAISTFAIFVFLTVIGGRRLLESKDDSTCVIGLVLTAIDGARQHKSSGGFWPLVTGTMIDSKQNR